MLKILLVVDNEMNRDMLRRCLEKKGYEVMEAGDGAEGIQKAQRRTRGPDSDGPSYAGS